MYLVVLTYSVAENQWGVDLSVRTPYTAFV